MHAFNRLIDTIIKTHLLVHFEWSDTGISASPNITPCTAQRIDCIFLLLFQTSSFKACAIECCALPLLLLLIKLPLSRVVFHLILCQLFSSICSASAHYMPLIVKWCRTKSLRLHNEKSDSLKPFKWDITFCSFFSLSPCDSIIVRKKTTMLERGRKREQNRRVELTKRKIKRSQIKYNWKMKHNRLDHRC